MNSTTFILVFTLGAVLMGCGTSGSGDSGVTGAMPTGGETTEQSSQSDSEATTQTPTSSQASTSEVNTQSSGSAETDSSTQTGTSGIDAVCGDGLVSEGEECDDGNQEELDACSLNCISSRYVFVTSSEYQGYEIGGLEGADEKCQQHAEDAGLPGSYKAWLAGKKNEEAPFYRFASRDFTGWYILPKSIDQIAWEEKDFVAKGWAGLTGQIESDALENPIIKTETGAAIPANAIVWTNTNRNGKNWSVSDNRTCNNWDIGGEKLQGLFGDPKSTQAWNLVDARNCIKDANEEVSLHLYCFQVGL